jgi:hypothetical protein
MTRKRMNARRETKDWHKKRAKTSYEALALFKKLYE